jgi:hypothetical protein
MPDTRTPAAGNAILLLLRNIESDAHEITLLITQLRHSAPRTVGCKRRLHRTFDTHKAIGGRGA